MKAIDRARRKREHKVRDTFHIQKRKSIVQFEVEVQVKQWTSNRDAHMTSGNVKEKVVEVCPKRQKQTTNKPRPITVSILFVEGLSQEVCRISYLTGVRCAFFTPNTLCSLYTSKDWLPTDSITSAVYSVKCKTCTGEYVGETLRALCVRKKEHCNAIRLGQSSRSAIS